MRHTTPLPIDYVEECPVVLLFSKDERQEMFFVVWQEHGELQVYEAIGVFRLHGSPEVWVFNEIRSSGVHVSGSARLFNDVLSGSYEQG